MHDKITRIELVHLLRVITSKIDALPEEWAFSKIVFAADPTAKFLTASLKNQDVSLYVPLIATLDDKALVSQAKGDICSRLDAMNDALKSLLDQSEPSPGITQIVGRMLDRHAAEVVEHPPLAPIVIEPTCRVHSIPLNARGECPACNKEKRA